MLHVLATAGAALLLLVCAIGAAATAWTLRPPARGGTWLGVAALALPDDALVLAEWPTIVRAGADIPTMATRHALAQLDALVAQRPVFLLCDMFCEPGFAGAAGISACQQVLERFALDEVTATALDRRRYGLYRIRGRREVDAAAPPCPFITRPPN
jgi:hypothetical protein